MKLTIDILRQKDSASAPYKQIIEFEALPDDTVTTLLNKINASDDLRDINGNPVGIIHWQCSCLQKKCGACAMRINGNPALACDTKLSTCKRGKLSLEPLRKFPTVRDLIVDRSLMMDNLRSIHNWLEQTAHHSKKAAELSYDASRCLQCGCCLEVCPNFMPDGDFYGAAAFVPASRILAQLEKSNPQELTALYQKNIYGGCGKSLSCHNICPAGIDVEQKLSNANAVAVWKRFFKG
ncbi:MAG: 2Fe-2S iron-sulfur cluster-binding protein [Ruminococcus sp.]|nr:2Fe-2S iron-sulfur cluster-binding protein [Ruminococcus sp.]